MFAVYGWTNRESVDELRVVRISAKEVAWLKEIWMRQWRRLPDDLELRVLVMDYLKERLLAISAKELGLEENDTVVRRRLAQKMEFLVQDTARLAQPTEEDLLRLYGSDHMRYQTPAQVTFNQIYFKAEKSAREGLNKTRMDSSAEIGDPSLLEHEFIRVDEQTIKNLFGQTFAEKTFSVEPGQWHGPVESEYGFHLIWVHKRETAHSRPFEDVRLRVIEEWERLQQAKIKEEFFAGLLKKI